MIDCDLIDTVRAYVRAYVWRHGRDKSADAFGVSRYTLWRFLERGHVGRSLPRAVLDTVGSSVEALDAARRELVVDLPSLRIDDTLRPLPEVLEDTLLLLCATPLATEGE